MLRVLHIIQIAVMSTCNIVVMGRSCALSIWGLYVLKHLKFRSDIPGKALSLFPLQSRALLGKEGVGEAITEAGGDNGVSIRSGER